MDLSLSIIYFILFVLFSQICKNQYEIIQLNNMKKVRSKKLHQKWIRDICKKELLEERIYFNNLLNLQKNVVNYKLHEMDRKNLTRFVMNY